MGDDYKEIKADYKKFLNTVQANGLEGMTVRWTYFSFAIVGLAAANYGGPQIANAIAEITRQQVQILSPEAMSIWKQATFAALENVEHDVNFLVDSILKPTVNHAKMLAEGSLADHYRAEIEKWEPMDLPIGQALLSARDSMTNIDRNSHHGLIRWGGDAMKYAFNSVAIVAAITISSKAVAKTLNGAAKAFQTIKDAGEITKGVFSLIKNGIERGIASALGREAPAVVANPFAKTKPEDKSLSDLLSQDELSEDEVRVVAQKIDRKIEKMQADIDQKSKELQVAEEDRQEIMLLVRDLKKRVARAESPERIAGIAREAMIDFLEDDADRTPAPTEDATVTLH